MNKINQVIIPRVNANDDEARVVDIFVINDQNIIKGQAILTIETTKSTIEVVSESSGIIKNFNIKLNDIVSVGQTVCDLFTSKDELIANKEKENIKIKNKITAKAKKRALELGIDIKDLQNKGFIKLKDIELIYKEKKTLKEPTNLTEFNLTSYTLKINNTPTIIFGGGGHSATVIDTLISLNANIIGVIDDFKPTGVEVLSDINIIGDTSYLKELLKEYKSDELFIFLGVGGQTDNRPREKVFRMLKDLGANLPPLVHPKAIIGEGSCIGQGTAIFPGAVIGPRCHVGDGVIINQGVQLCHDSVVYDYAHLAPGAIIAGWCKIGERTTIGMGSTVLNHTEIGYDCLVHNGTNVTSSLKDITEITADGKRYSRIYDAGS